MLLVSGWSASSTTRGRKPDHLVFSKAQKDSTSSQLMKSIIDLFMKVRSYSEQTGLFVGSIIFFYVVPARTLPNQGCTSTILPSELGAAIPKVLLAILLSYTTWLPPTMQILLFALGSSFSLILSAQTPVQLITYFPQVLYVLLVRRSLKTTPSILPSGFLIKSTNSALLRALAGTKLSGILMPLPTVAVRTAVRSILESLKEPSSQTTPMLYLGLMWGNISTNSWRLRKQGG